MSTQVCMVHKGDHYGPMEGEEEKIHIIGYQIMVGGLGEIQVCMVHTYGLMA